MGMKGLVVMDPMVFGGRDEMSEREERSGEGDEPSIEY